jgi:hypothetical protein
MTMSQALFGLVAGYKPETAFLNAVAGCAQQRIPEFRPQEISMLMYAFAKLRHNAFLLMRALVPEVASRAFEFRPQASAGPLAESAWCHASPLQRVLSIVLAAGTLNARCGAA